MKMNRTIKEMRQANEALEEGLSETASSAQTDMVFYIRSQCISLEDQEKVRGDIAAMLLEGEGRGLTPTEIIGEDYKAFCDELIAEIPKLGTSQRILAALSTDFLSLSVLMAIWTVFTPINMLILKKPWYILPLELGDMIFAAAIVLAATLVTVYIMRGVFGGKLWKPIVGLVIIIAVALCLVISFPNTVLINIHIGVSAAIALALYVIYKVIDLKVK